MTFGREWALLAVLLPLAWFAWEWQRTTRKVLLLLKALCLLAVALALADPQMPVAETKMAVAILVDTSASMTDSDLARASEIASGIERGRGRHWTRVVPFARSPRSPDPTESAGSWKLRHTAGESGRATDIETAIRESAGAMPAGLVPRIVLISDGKQNNGSAERAAWQARQLGIPVDAFPMPGRPKPALQLESTTMPAVAFSGERFPIDLTVVSPKRAVGTIEITAEGKTIGSNQVSIEAGKNQFRVHASLNEAGAIDLAGSVRAADLGEVLFARSISLRRPKVLFATQDPRGTESHLASTLQAAGFEMEITTDVARARLTDYQIVTLNNWDLEGMAPGSKADVEEFVKQGGGLLVIGGEKNIYVENKAVEDALDRVLPAKLAPPRSPEGTCVILIVDKSSSMEGRKMELARLAAIGVIDNLRPHDMVGVLIFDNSFQWAVPVRKAEDRAMIKRIVAGITPDGGTQIAPALAEAYRRALPVTATYKHVVLLTDGISEEGDSIALSKEAALSRVTISTVGLGQDVNRAYLEKVASFSKGKSYFLVDPSGLEQILLRDVLEHTGSTAVEKPIQPSVARAAEILEGIEIETAPALRGYVRFVAKPSAETILIVDRKDPLLTRWQYGLGRAAVFSSDAKSRWAEAWVSWKGFDRFWANMFRDLLPHTQAGEQRVNFDSANGELVVEYHLASHVPEPQRIPEIFVFGPEGFRAPLPVAKAAEGTYRGKLRIGERRGLFRIRPVEDLPAFPETGFYREQEEFNDYGSNEPLMRQIAEFTGGHVRPPVSRIFDNGGRSIAGTMRLWPGLLAAAVILNLAEVVLRKWRGIRAALRPAAAST